MNHLSLSKSRALATWLGALAIIFGTLFSAMPASAADAPPSPEPEAALIIKGKVKNEGVGVAGIGLTISGPSFSGKATTDEAGTWSITVPTKAVYDVEIDLATLLKGQPELASRQP